MHSIISQVFMFVNHVHVLLKKEFTKSKSVNIKCLAEFLQGYKLELGSSVVTLCVRTIFVFQSPQKQMAFGGPRAPNGKLVLS